MASFVENIENHRPFSGPNSIENQRPFSGPDSIENQRPFSGPDSIENQRPFSGPDSIDNQRLFSGPDSMKFESYEKLVSFIQSKEKAEYIQLFVKDSRTIECAAKRGITKPIKSALKYYEITYRCIHSGVRKSTSTGIRPNQSTFRKDCPFVLRFRASTDGQFLIAVKLVDEHNHQHNEEVYSLLPRQRQLDEPTKKMVEHMLKLRANKKLLQTELLGSKKKVTLKDLHNISAVNNEEDTLENALNFLMGKDGSTVEIVKDSQNVFRGLFYQDSEMKRLYKAFPEILFVDAIYKVSNLRIPLYIFAIEDGNGETEIVAFFLAAVEDYANIKAMVDIFKKHNESYTSTTAVMTDKDFEERAAFKVAFPEAKLLICLFHTLRSFRREANCEKMGITSGERAVCLQFAERLTYSKNEDEYQAIYEEMKKTNLLAFVNYYNKNWHPIREEWVPALQGVFTLGNRTNNRLECINSKVMQVVKRHSSLPDLVKNLDCLVLSLRTERDERTSRIHLKVPLNINFVHEEQKKYLTILTPYAYGLVEGKFKLKNRVTVQEELEYFKVLSSEGTLTTTLTTCSCQFWVTVKLPCHHIFHVREVKGLTLFSEDLIPNRWTKRYYLSNSRLLNHVEACGESTISTTATRNNRKVLSQHEKYRVVMKKLQDVASLISEAPSRIFPQRLEVLDNLLKLWGDGKEAVITEFVPHLEDTPSGEIEETQEEDAPNGEIVATQNEDAPGGEVEIIQTRNCAQEVPVIEVTKSQEEGSGRLPSMPSKIKKRGRPKGNDLTVIGLPSKKRKVNKLLPFEKKSPKDRDIMILKWFVSDVKARSAMEGVLIEEEDVEVCLNKIPASCLDPAVDNRVIRRYVTEDAWLAIEHIIKVKRDQPLWLCPLCMKDIKDNSIYCNSCLSWYHMACCAMKNKPKSKKWYCRPCHKL